MIRTKEQLREIAASAHALSVTKKETGFQTRRAVVNLLSPLSEQELIEVSKIIAAMTAQGENTHDPRNSK